MTRTGETLVIKPKTFDAQRVAAPLIIGILAAFYEFQKFQQRLADRYPLYLSLLVCALLLGYLWKNVLSKDWSKKNTLKLTSEGLWLGKKFYRWGRIEQFGIEKDYVTLFSYFMDDKRIFWLLNDRPGRAKPTDLAEISARNYPMEAEELAALLNDALSRHTGRNTAIYDGPQLFNRQLAQGFLHFSNLIGFIILSLCLLLSLRGC